MKDYIKEQKKKLTKKFQELEIEIDSVIDNIYENAVYCFKNGLWRQLDREVPYTDGIFEIYILYNRNCFLSLGHIIVETDELKGVKTISILDRQKNEWIIKDTIWSRNFDSNDFGKDISWCYKEDLFLSTLPKKIIYD